MNRIILMRHAKSSWSSPANGDHARPLSDRGRTDAPQMAAALAARGWAPDLVISSDSERTRQTWALMRATFPDAEAHFTNALYLAGPREIYDEVQQRAAAGQTVLVLGHNPGWEVALEVMSGVAETMTTANCALLQREASWDEPYLGDFELIALLRPPK